MKRPPHLPLQACAVLLAGACLAAALTPVAAQVTPLAAFSASETAGCAPFPVSFSDRSVNAVAWLWDFGNGSRSDAVNPEHVYTTPGRFRVVLTVTAADGSSDSASAFISVHPAPVASFTTDTLAGHCENDNRYRFRNTSAGGDTWLWDLGDGTVSAERDPEHSYTAPGDFFITLIAASSYGCRSSLRLPDPVTIHSKAGASFSVNPATSCDPGEPFRFTGDYAATSHRWDFGDGRTSDEARPLHIYGAYGNYTVRLMTRNSAGCFDTAASPGPVSVRKLSPPPFTADAAAGCAPLTVAFRDTLPPDFLRQWNFGDGLASALMAPSHTYTATGKYTVSLTVDDGSGCSATAVRPDFVRVTDRPDAGFRMNDSTGCGQVTVRFTPSGQGAAYRWDFGDGSTSDAISPEHLFSRPGYHSVTLTVTDSNGCSNTVTRAKAVLVRELYAIFGVTQKQGCIPHAVTFGCKYGGGSYRWDFGDGNTGTGQRPDHTYLSAGTYTVTLIVSDSASACSDTVVAPNFIRAVDPALPPDPPDTVEGCVPFPASFTAGVPGATAWQWNFGDGSVSTEENPQHVFTAPGLYTVSMTAEVSATCRRNVSAYRVFRLRGGATDFLLTKTGCPPYIVSFRDTSLNAVSWLWRFGDGTTSSERNPVHTYGDSGCFSPSVTITTSDGCTQTVEKPGAVCVIPLTAGIVMVPGGNAFPKLVQFYAGSTGAVSWHWDFGDGHTSPEKDPLHTYLEPGDYLVTLTISDGTCTRTFYYLTGQGPPGGDVRGDSIVFDRNTPPRRGCAPYTVHFTSARTDAVAWLWKFGDGGTSALRNPVHTYFYPGAYGVTLITRDAAGNADTVVHGALVSVAGPVADFTMEKEISCDSVRIRFTDRSEGAVSRSWSFGDGRTSSDENPVHAFAYDAGRYAVVLTAKDSAGCSSTASEILQSPAGSAFLASGGGCPGDSVRFTALAANTGTLRWDFGDSTTSDERHPVHVYRAAGSYRVTLAVKEGSCERIYAADDPVVITGPSARFIATGAVQGCDSLTVSFSDRSAGAETWRWDFGDGTASDKKDPEHCYTAPGNYYVTLAVTGAGCSDTFTLDIPVVVSRATAGFTATAASECLPAVITCTDTAANSASRIWDFGDGTTDTARSAVHLFDAPPAHPIRLSVTDIYGCTADTVLPAWEYLEPRFDTAAVAGCAPFPVSFSDHSANAVRRRWYFGDGGSDTAAAPVHTYLSAGVYDVTLVAYGASGCSDTLPSWSHVTVRKPEASFAAPGATTCPPAPASFTDLSPGAVAWQWDFGDGSHSSLRNPSHIYGYPGAYDVSLIVADTAGCTDTTIQAAAVLVPGPRTDFRAEDSVACTGQPFAFTDLTGDAASWSWNFGDGNVSAQRSPVHTYTLGGSFVVSLRTSDSSGCRTIHFDTVRVEEVPQPSFFAVTGGCESAGVQFTNTTTTDAEWAWDFGDGSTSEAKHPKHFYAAPGTYEVRLSAESPHGCRDTASEMQRIAVEDTVPPATGLLGVTVLSDTSVSLLWAAISDSRFLAYVVYRYDGPSGKLTALDTITDFRRTTFTDRGLNTLRDVYCYTIGVMDRCGYDAEAGAQDFHCTVNVSASPLDRMVHVRWTPYKGCGVGRYEVHRWDAPGGRSRLIASVPGHQVAVFDTAATCPLNYIYQVRAISLCGRAIDSRSDTAAAQPRNVVIAVSADIVRSTVVENRYVLTEWKAPAAGAGRENVSSWSVHRSENGGSYREIATLPPEAGEYVDRDVDVAASRYSYRVIPGNKCGISTAAGQEGTSILLQAREEDGGVRLYWTPYLGWAEGVDYYIIEKKDAQGNWKLLKKVPGDAGTYREE